MSNIENNMSKVNPNPSSHKRASNQPNSHSNPVKNIDSIDININMSKPALALTDTGTASGYITNENLLKILDDSIAQLEKERDKLENSFKNMDLTKEEQEYYTKKYPNLIISPFTGEIYSPRDAENFTSPNYYGAGWQNTIDKEAYTKDYNAFLREYLHIQTNYDEMIAMYNQDILTLQSSRYSLEQQVKEQPYIDLQQTDDYIQYINNLGDVDSRINEIDEELVLQYNKLADSNADLISSSIPQLKYMTQEDKGVYCYLYDKKGREAAEQYLVDIADKLNKAEGFANSADFLASIAKKDGNGNVITDADGKIIIDESLLTDAKVAFKGLLDGVDNFSEGLDNVFSSNGIMSSNQYAQTFILEALYNCGEESKLPDIYNFNSSLGNIAIPTLAAILFSTVYPPAGATLFTLGATEVTAAGIYGYSLTGLSIYGNAKNTAYMSGASFWTAQGYGICNALSEMGLGLFLGNLPFLNGGAKLALIDLLKEGIEEYIQEYVSAGWNSIFLKQPTEDLATLDENARKSFLYGLIMSGLLNGVTTTTVKIADQLVVISIDKVAEYMNKHTGATFVEAIEKTSNVQMSAPSKMSPSGFFDSFRLNAVKKQIEKLASTKNSAIAQVNLTDAIGEYMTNIYANNKSQLRVAARASMELLKENGFTEIAAARVLSQIYGKTLTRNGYDSYYDPLTGIKINIVKNIDWKNQIYTPVQVMQQIQTLPPEMQAMVKEINFYDTFNPDDFCWEIEYNMKNFLSQATGGNGQVNYWSTNSSIYSIAVLPHEIAHTYDRICASKWGVTTGRISESGLWLNAMAQDLQTSGKKGVTSYASESNSSVEDFAEAVTLYYINPSALDEFPARKAILEQFLP